MQPTTQTWRAIGLGVVLAVVGLLAGRDFLFFGTAGVGAIVLAHQYGAYRTFQRTTQALQVSVEPHRRAAPVGETLSVTASASLSEPVEAPIRVDVPLPVGTRAGEGTDRQLDLEPGETEAAITFTCSFPIAGQFEFPPATITIGGPDDAFVETLQERVGHPITIDPRRSLNVHVGQGGDRIAAAYGEHPGGRGEGGILPDEVREYAPGDSLANIDWKATARFSKPHVREFETETDRKTVMIVDHRANMGVGPDGETMLDYVREVALGISGSAAEFDDPIGLVTVGEAGLTAEWRPATTPRSYRKVRDTLFDLAPAGGHISMDGMGQLTNPASARATGQQLQRTDSAFSNAVAPFLTAAESYVHRIEGDPLFQTVRRVQSTLSGSVWTVIMTDDTGRNQVRDAIRLAAGQGNYVTVFLTPRILFEDRDLTDLEVAYDRYVEFEDFRRVLERIPRTTVYEVGPGDRLEAILAARRSQP